MGNQVSATAPATVANLGCGLDILGFPLSGIQGLSEIKGDVVHAIRTNDFEGVRLERIVNNTGLPHLDLPLGPENVVEAVGNKVLKLSGETGYGIKLILEKNMRIGTGMGSSASSGVSGAVSVNALLDNPFPKDHPKMLEAVVYGEAVAIHGRQGADSGLPGHGDNALAALLGGFVFIYNLDTYEHKRFEGGKNIYFVVASPLDISSKTGEMRARLPSYTGDLARFSAGALKKYIESDIPIDFSSVPYSTLGGNEMIIRVYLDGAMCLIDGIIGKNAQMLGRGMNNDRIVTPVRAKFIRGFHDVTEAALRAGAYGSTISGSGSALVSVTDDYNTAQRVARNKQDAFGRNGVESKVYICQVDNVGARLID